MRQLPTETWGKTVFKPVEATSGMSGSDTEHCHMSTFDMSNVNIWHVKIRQNRWKSGFKPVENRLQVSKYGTCVRMWHVKMWHHHVTIWHLEIETCLKPVENRVVSESDTGMSECDILRCEPDWNRWKTGLCQEVTYSSPLYYLVNRVEMSNVDTCCVTCWHLWCQMLTLHWRWCQMLTLVVSNVDTMCQNQSQAGLNTDIPPVCVTKW